MKNKAQVDPMKVIMLAVILIVVVIVILSIFTNIFGKQAKQLGGITDQLRDSDGDGKSDFIDKCPCDDPDIAGCAKKITYTGDSYSCS